MICQTTAPLAVGQKLTLELGLPSDLESLRIAAEIVERTDDGFSARFHFDGPEERRLVLGALDRLVSTGKVPQRATQEVRRTTDAADPAERGQHSPRVSPRLYYPKIVGRVHFNLGWRNESGSIHDISLSGAHIADSTVRLQPGEQIELLFLMGAKRIKALASVVRQTPTGFAVRFLRIERKLERLIAAATPKARTR